MNRQAKITARRSIRGARVRHIVTGEVRSMGWSSVGANASESFTLSISSIDEHGETDDCFTVSVCAELAAEIVRNWSAKLQETG